ncbi:hypothetical protein [Celeribacter baekdonensis]|nr:hypothetical protein [Celeribacter baekdonensis]
MLWLGIAIMVSAQGSGADLALGELNGGKVRWVELRATCCEGPTFPEQMS